MHHTNQNRRLRKSETIQARVERPLAERLRMAAAASGIEPSDKLRRILDATLPPLPHASDELELAEQALGMNQTSSRAQSRAA